MSAESTSAATDGLLHGDVADYALLGIESFDFCVALQVDKQFLDGLARLLWPSSITPLVLSHLGMSGDVLVEASERNNLFMSDDSVHVLDGSWDSHAFNVIGSFKGVLEMNSQIRNFGFSGCT